MMGTMLVEVIAVMSGASCPQGFQLWLHVHHSSFTSDGTELLLTSQKRREKGEGEGEEEEKQEQGQEEEEERRNESIIFSP